MNLLLKIIAGGLVILVTGTGTLMLVGPVLSSPAKVESEPLPQVELPLPNDKIELRALRNAVEDLPFSSLREEAQAKLQRAGDAGLAVLIDSGLYHKVPLVRTYFARDAGKCRRSKSA
jgi:hypothetical protein